MPEIHPSDHTALDNLLNTRPLWHSNQLAGEALALDSNVILHAGPPFDSPAEVPLPVLNSACVALVFERLAADFDEARSQILSGEIVLQPAQDHATVVPLAGVVSASMWLHKVADPNHPLNPSYAPFNGGNGPAMRLGLCSHSALAHLQWINTEFAAVLNNCTFAGLDLLSLSANALQLADDCHGRTIAATGLLLKKFQAEMQDQRSIRFLEEGPSFALNLLMAAAKCMLAAAVGQPESGVVTAAAGNGVTTGIQVAGNPGTWFRAAASPPSGHLGDYPAARALGAIGDSAVVDMAGFGAMAVSYAPAQRDAFGSYLPADADQLPGQLLACVHEGFGTLNFRTGLSAHTVVEKNTTPIVSLGIIDRNGEAGRLGGGIFRYPVEIFQQAIDSMRS